MCLHYNQNPIYLFPEKELRRISPNFHIHVSVSDLYIPTIGLPILLQENMWIDPFLGILVSNFGFVSLQCTHPLIIQQKIHDSFLTSWADVEYFRANHLHIQYDKRYFLFY